MSIEYYWSIESSFLVQWQLPPYTKGLQLSFHYKPNFGLRSKNPQTKEYLPQNWQVRPGSVVEFFYQVQRNWLKKFCNMAPKIWHCSPEFWKSSNLSLPLCSKKGKEEVKCSSWTGGGRYKACVTRAGLRAPARRILAYPFLFFLNGSLDKQIYTDANCSRKLSGPITSNDSPSHAMPQLCMYNELINSGHVA